MIGAIAHPVDWSDIDAWARLTGTVISPSEARALRRLSCAIAHQVNMSRDPLCISPLDEVASASRREQVANKVRSVFSIFKKGGAP